ncbi:MAG: TolC family protein, partial [Phycisphaerae bacterium]
MKQRPENDVGARRFVRPCLAILLCLPACQSTMPSARLQSEIALPVPASASTLLEAGRFDRSDAGETYRLTPLSVIRTAFNRQPAIKSSYHRFKSEEARYDFFYTSRDSLTPRFRWSNSYAESRDRNIEAADPVTRTRDHSVALSVEKRFFDTSALDVSVGLQAGAVDEALGNQPFVSARLRYPLWASREKLERTSEEIFWKNQVDDAQLGYIQGVRNRLESVLFQFYNVVLLRRECEHRKQWQSDLEALLTRIDGDGEKDRDSDRKRVRAEIASAIATLRDVTGRFDVQIERLKAACGLPFDTVVELDGAAFNPFEGQTHEELFRISIETDPEIETLRNAKRNAEVQLDLARRGRWDIAFLADGTSNLDGGGEEDGLSDWAVSLGLDVSAVDSRVTDSLIRQAESNIAHFEQRIVEREDQVFVDTFEPILRMETLAQSRRELERNLPRFQNDYRQGLEEYFEGKLNIDDLLTRREELFWQEYE